MAVNANEKKQGLVQRSLVLKLRVHVSPHTSAFNFMRSISNEKFMFAAIL